MLVLTSLGGAGCGLVLGAGDYVVGAGGGAALVGSGGGTSSTSGPSTNGSSMSVTASSGSVSGSGGGGGALAGIAVSPSATTVLALTTTAFTASGAASLGGVMWTIVEGGGGKTDAEGRYTAPAAAGTYHLRATSVADSSEHADATITVVDAASATTIASAGTLAGATGHGSQTHIVYAAGSSEWWLFFNQGDVPELLTMHSKDFTTWASGESAGLPKGNSGDGRDLSVAYRSLNGHDVAHITQGYAQGTLGRYHLRAAISDGHIAFGEATEQNSGGDTHPDGSATVITPAGVVIDSTGWEGTPQTPPLGPCGNGDVDSYQSKSADDGTTNFDSVGFTEQVLWCVGSHVNARQLLAFGDTVVHLYEDGGGDPNPVNILTSVRQSNGVWLPVQTGANAITPPRVFFTDQSFGLDDWAATIAGGKVHAVRRLKNAFEHQSLSDASGGWSAAGAIPAEATLGNSGLFLAPYGSGLILVALSDDAGSKIRYTAFDGALWSAWATLSKNTASRNFIGGFAPESGPKPAVIWSQTNGANSDIAALLIP